MEQPIKISVEDISRIASQELRGHLSRVHQIMTPDREYKSVSRELMKKIMRRTRSDRYGFSDYESEVFDCDDFALLMHSKVVEWSWKDGRRTPLAFGQLWGEIKVQDQWVGHAINWFIDENEKIWFLEPQTDEIFSPEGRAKDIYHLRM